MYIDELRLSTYVGLFITCWLHRAAMQPRVAEWMCAEFILEEDVKQRMSTTLGLLYLVVLLNVFVTLSTGLA